MQLGHGWRHYRLGSAPGKHFVGFRCGSITQRYYHHERKWPKFNGKRGIAGGTVIPTPSGPQKSSPEPRYLQDIPLSSLFNSLLVLSFATLPPRILGSIIQLTRSHTHFLENNKTLRWLFKKTFYNHFCIGEGRAEITTNIARLRQMGMTGVVLGFAREAQTSIDPPSRLTREDVQLCEWTEMNKETVNKLEPGDFVGIRCTGAGLATIDCMTRFSDAVKSGSKDVAVQTVGAEVDVFYESMYQICELAVSRGVRLLVDAESSLTQHAIDHVTLRLMEKFNSQERAHVFNTYQMYFKSTLQRIISHLDRASQKNYTAGIKMVRGAFIHTEPERQLIHSTKEATDDAYDTAVAFLLGGSANGPQQVHRELQPLVPSPSSQSQPWRAELVLATHNSESVKRALKQCSIDNSSLLHPVPSAYRPSAASGVQGIFFAQLMGMADEVSLKLATEIRQLSEHSSTKGIPKIGVYKYTIWGSIGECLLYLLRRAEENQDAMKRSKETAMAICKELARRVGI